MFETDFFSTYLLPGTLAIIMLGMGLSLTGKDFRNIFLQPRAVITGLISQMVLLPAVAIGIAAISGLSPEMKVGIVLIAACPGGAVSNLLSYLLKGNVALSVSMTSINSFLVVFTIPTIVNIALRMFMGTESDLELPFWNTVLQVLLITVIPCVIGIVIRYRNEALALRVERPLKVAMPIMLALAMVAAIFLEKKEGVSASTQQYFEVFPWVLLLNLIGMFGGLGIAKVLRLTQPMSLTIGLEVGLQNSGLAIAVATSATLLANPSLAIPASAYALFSFFTAVIFGLLVNRREVGLKDFFASAFSNDKAKR